MMYVQLYWHENWTAAGNIYIGTTAVKKEISTSENNNRAALRFNSMEKRAL